MKLAQAILPLAGLGTRFLPWTKVVPKELLPIGNRPVVQFLVDECLSVGITDICFVLSHGKESIMEFFKKDEAFEEDLKSRGKGDALSELARYDSINFHMVYQEEQKGDGHAILQAADWVESDQVAVLFGDDLIVGKQSGLMQLVNAIGSEKNAKIECRNANSELRTPNSAMLCLQNIPKEDVSRYGIVDVEESEDRLKVVRGLVEKPKPEEAPSTLCIVGKYLLPKEIFSVLPSVESSQGGEIRIIDALMSMLGSTPVYGYVFEGMRYDTGTPKGWREAVLGLT